jgi:hypothetical protein
MTCRPTAAAPKHLLHRFAPSAKPARRSATSYCPVVDIVSGKPPYRRLIDCCWELFQERLSICIRKQRPALPTWQTLFDIFCRLVRAFQLLIYYSSCAGEHIRQTGLERRQCSAERSESTSHITALRQPIPEGHVDTGGSKGWSCRAVSEVGFNIPWRVLKAGVPKAHSYILWRRLRASVSRYPEKQN